jgi:polyphenol oxidase
LNPDWIIPDWPAPPGVRAVFTTRRGGRSRGPFDSMNLGDHVRDDPPSVAANRERLAHDTGARPVFLRQVHGNAALLLTTASADGRTADASFTADRGLACTIMVADCLPLLFALDDGSCVGAAHAGWRGLAGAPAALHDQSVKGPKKGVLETFYESFSAFAQSNRARVAIKIIAWLGPCIGPDAFEVGPEVQAAFDNGPEGSAGCFKPVAGGRYLADLPGLARLRLRALGVDSIYGNDGSAAWCTASNPSRFFSHRRDAAVTGGNGFLTTGRMAACIWRV